MKFNEKFLAELSKELVKRDLLLEALLCAELALALKKAGVTITLEVNQ